MQILPLDLIVAQVFCQNTNDLENILKTINDSLKPGTLIDITIFVETCRKVEWFCLIWEVFARLIPNTSYFLQLIILPSIPIFIFQVS